MSQTKAQLIDNLVQPITGALGSASAPTFSFTTDPNTGLYSPGADQLALTTGGTGRLFIDASGNVGVGVSPSAWNTDYRVIQLKGGGAISNDGGSTEVRFSQNAFVDSAAFNKYIATAPATRYRQSNGVHIWETAASGTAGDTITFNERLRITSAGLVGIGTSAPTQAISIGGVSSTPGDFKGLAFQSGSTEVGYVRSVVQDGNNLALSFGTYNSGLSEKLRITAAGLVGIGNSVPRGIVHIGADLNNGSTDAGAINLKQTGNSAAQGIYLERSGERRGYSIYIGGDADALTFQRNNFGTKADVMSLTRDGLVGIGSNAPQVLTHLSTSTDTQLRVESTSASGTNEAALQLIRGSNQSAIKNKAGGIEFFVQGLTNEVARIDSSGRLGVGVSSPASVIHAKTGTSFAGVIVDNSGTTGGGYFQARQDGVGKAFFGVSGAWISDTSSDTAVSSETGSNIRFFTNGQTIERARITSGGYFKASPNTVYNDNSGAYHELSNNLSNQSILVSRVNNASYAAIAHLGGVYRSANSGYAFQYWYSGNGSTDPFSDLEFNLAGNGIGYADGSWNGGGADYAEMFEWSDGNTNNEDRRGISVVLDNHKIREAQDGEDPIGVISGNPSVLGDTAWNHWADKFIRDDFGSYVLEEHNVIEWTDEEGVSHSYEDWNIPEGVVPPADATVLTHDGNGKRFTHRKLNPAYDPNAEYISREARPEWDCVGLMGKLRIRKGQVTGSRWIKMRDISDTVEEWLVR